jgi:hypothetical protein
MKVILKYNNTCTSFLPRFNEIVSAVLRKLKMYENANPLPLTKKKEERK